MPIERAGMLFSSSLIEPREDALEDGEDDKAEKEGGGDEVLECELLIRFLRIARAEGGTRTRRTIGALSLSSSSSSAKDVKPSIGYGVNGV
jgi:hypothetical protein